MSDPTRAELTELEMAQLSNKLLREKVAEYRQALDAARTDRDRLAAEVEALTEPCGECGGSGHNKCDEWDKCDVRDIGGGKVFCDDCSNDAGDCPACNHTGRVPKGAALLREAGELVKEACSYGFVSPWMSAGFNRDRACDVGFKLDEWRKRLLARIEKGGE